MPQIGRLKNVGTYSIFFYSLASLYLQQGTEGSSILRAMKSCLLKVDRGTEVTSQ